VSEIRYALLRGSEDGRPFRMLNEAELASLLADPADWGVAEFVGPDDFHELDSDPNYWPDKVAVLMQVEILQPERARGYSLPAADPDAGSWRRGPAGPITLGQVAD
jgi:hypothetical protein